MMPTHHPDTHPDTRTPRTRAARTPSSRGAGAPPGRRSPTGGPTPSRTAC